jgi:hypothetical protein
VETRNPSVPVHKGAVLPAVVDAVAVLTTMILAVSVAASVTGGNVYSLVVVIVTGMLGCAGAGEIIQPAARAEDRTNH